jgi:hypothetical protein
VVNFGRNVGQFSPETTFPEFKIKETDKAGICPDDKDTS